MHLAQSKVSLEPFQRLIGSRDEVLVELRRVRNSFAYLKIRMGALTVQRTVKVWETQLGGLPQNLQCKFLKISESTKSIEKKGI